MNGYDNPILAQANLETQQMTPEQRRQMAVYQLLAKNQGGGLLGGLMQGLGTRGMNSLADALSSNQVSDSLQNRMY